MTNCLRKMNGQLYTSRTRGVKINYLHKVKKDDRVEASSEQTKRSWKFLLS